MIPVFLALPSRAAGRPVLAVVTAFAVVAMFAACSLSRPYPAKRTYLLEPTSPAAAAMPKQASVRVGVVNVAAPFRGKAFVFRETDLKYDADFYDEFFVAPTAMLSDATAKAIAAANVFRRVVPFGASADDGDYVLDGFVSELYGDTRNPASPMAVLAIAFYLSPNAVPGSSVIWSREYRQRIPASGTSADAMARAWNSALSSIFADLARDLAAADLPAK